MSRPDCFERLFTITSSTCAKCDYTDLCDSNHKAKYELYNRGDFRERAEPVINWSRRLRLEEEQRIANDKSKLLPYENTVL